MSQNPNNLLSTLIFLPLKLGIGYLKAVLVITLIVVYLMSLFVGLTMGGIINPEHFLGSSKTFNLQINFLKDPYITYYFQIAFVYFLITLALEKIFGIKLKIDFKKKVLLFLLPQLVVFTWAFLRNMIIGGYPGEVLSLFSGLVVILGILFIAVVLVDKAISKINSIKVSVSLKRKFPTDSRNSTF